MVTNEKLKGLRVATLADKVELTVSDGHTTTTVTLGWHDARAFGDGVIKAASAARAKAKAQASPP